MECLYPSPPTFYRRRLLRNETDLDHLEDVRLVANKTRLKAIVVSRAMPVITHENLNLRRGANLEVTLQVKFSRPPESVESHITQY